MLLSNVCPHLSFDLPSYIYSYHPTHTYYTCSPSPPSSPHLSTHASPPLQHTSRLLRPRPARLPLGVLPQRPVIRRVALQGLEPAPRSPRVGGRGHAARRRGLAALRGVLLARRWRLCALEVVAAGCGCSCGCGFLCSARRSRRGAGHFAVVVLENKES